MRIQGSAISAGDLCDAWITRYDDGPLELPDLYRVTRDGVEWITDRHWMLRRDVIAFDDDWSVTPLTGKNQATAVAGIGIALTCDVAPCEQRFHPCFAGVLTAAGVEAFDVEGQPWSVLTRADGDRIGFLMPYAEKNGRVGLPIPAPADVVDLAQRIQRTPAAAVSLADSWAIAAHLEATR